MYESLIISGFGVIGTETLYEIIKKSKSQKLQISIIEKDYSNFPGGIAYSDSKSKFGFFNNPLRLSNNEFKNRLIFDGYPRSLAQANNLDFLLKKNNQKISLVLKLSVSLETVKKRILERKSLEKRLGELEATVVPDKQNLQDLALALFNMKEFIYLK